MKKKKIGRSVKKEENLSEEDISADDNEAEDNNPKQDKGESGDLGRAEQEEEAGQETGEEESPEQVSDSGRNDKKKDRTLVAIVGIIIAALVSIFLIGSLMQEEGDTTQFMYNDYLIMGKKNPGTEIWTWQTYIKAPGMNRSHLVEMRNRPSSVEDVPFQSDIKDLTYKAQGVKMTTDPELSSKAVLAMIEVGRIIGDRYQILNKPVQSGLTSTPNESQVISCTDTSEDRPVIYFRLGSPTSVYMKDGCIIVQGETDDDIIRAADKYAYVLMGVIPE